MTRRSFSALLVGCTLATGCIDLDVSAIQPAAGTAFTREEVLADPALIELVVAGVFVNFWGGATYNQPWIVLSVYGEEITTSATSIVNFNRTGNAANPSKIWEHVEEPRKAFDNSLTGTSFFARDPWSNFYESNAAATDMPRLMKERGIRIIDRATGNDNTARLLAFAKWIQGMSHVYLGLLFDSAAIISSDEDLSKVPVIPLKPYREVLDSGIKWLEETIRKCDSTSFLLPLANDVWVYNTAFTNAQMKAVAHTYIARALAYSARTPEARRDSVDWQLVKDHIAQGVTSNFGPSGFPNPLNAMDYRAAVTSVPQRINSICQGPPGNTNFCHPDHSGAFRVDLRLVGPADTSGAYQAWLASVDGPNAKTTLPFIVRTADQRIQAEGSLSPNQKPTFFKYTDLPQPVAFIDPINRGTQYFSGYWNSSRARNNHSQFPATGGGANRRNNADLGTAIQDAMVLTPEIRLLLAEAEYRLGNFQAAADIVNETRRNNGGLPDVTPQGVPQSTGCVPRRFDSTCGDLWDALMYEKRLETYGSGIAFFDARGWGCLLEGTMTQLPPPGRQLDLQGRVIYTFGGSPGQVGTAPRPTSCPIMHRQ